MHEEFVLLDNVATQPGMRTSFPCFSAATILRCLYSSQLVATAALSLYLSKAKIQI